MTDELWNQAKALASRPYDVKTDEDEYPDGSSVLLAYNPELPGCKAQGGSQPEAIANLAEARIDYIYALLVNKLPIPEPNPYQNNSWTGQSPQPTYVSAGGGVITFDFQSNKAADFDSITDALIRPDYREESSSSQLGGDLVKQA